MEVSLHQAFYAGAAFAFASGVVLAVVSARYYARHEIRAVTDELRGRTRQRVLAERGARLVPVGMGEAAPGGGHGRAMRARHLRGGRLARGGAAGEIPTTGGDDGEQDALTLAEPVVAQGSARPVGQDGCDVGGCEEFVMTMDVSVSDAGRGV